MNKVCFSFQKSSNSHKSYWYTFHNLYRYTKFKNKTLQKRQHRFAHVCAQINTESLQQDQTEWNDQYITEADINNQILNAELQDRERRILTSQLYHCVKPRILQQVIDENRHLLNTTHISAACASMANMLSRNPPFPINSIIYTVDQLIEFVDANVDQLDNGELATSVWMMGKIPTKLQLKLPKLESILKRGFDRAFELGSTMADHDLSRIIWTAAKLKMGEQVQIERLIDLALQIKPKQFKARGAATILWSMATLKIGTPESIDHFSRIVGGNIQGATKQGLANSLWAIKKMRYRHQFLLQQAEQVIILGYYRFGWKQVVMLFTAFQDFGVSDQKVFRILTRRFIKVMRIPKMATFNDWNTIPAADGVNFEEQDIDGKVTKKQTQSGVDEQWKERQQGQNTIQMQESSSGQGLNRCQGYTTGQAQETGQGWGSNLLKVQGQSQGQGQGMDKGQEQRKTKEQSQQGEYVLKKDQGQDTLQVQGLDQGQDQRQGQSQSQNKKWYRSDDTAYYSQSSRIETGITKRKLPIIEYDPASIILFGMALTNQPIEQASTIVDTYFASGIDFNQLGITAMCLLRRAQLQYQVHGKFLRIATHLQNRIKRVYRNSSNKIESSQLTSMYDVIKQNYEDAKMFQETLDGELIVDIAIERNRRKVAVQAGLQGFYTMNEPIELLGGAKGYYELLEWDGWKVIEVPYFKWDDQGYQQSVLEKIQMSLEKDV
eukprot:TRINITY_DN13622_c0_g2_i2.p1 TRINITY_DN13622_c0_g2~~TRINITY_DN13622_c0_g2_i2.p1  ORF type:complete len:742 (-),score=67.72 TRINITY_DN13622_c0_g2_i2:135-2291(-)